MNAKTISTQTVAIYLDVAQNALTSQSDTSLKMLTAAFELMEDACFIGDIAQIVRLGELSLILHQLDKAESLFTAAMRTSRREQSTADWLLARINDGLSEVYIAQKKMDKARRKIEQTVKIMMRIPDVNKDLVLQRMRRLVLIHYQLGETRKANDVLEKIKTIRN